MPFFFPLSQPPLHAHFLSLCFLSTPSCHKTQPTCFCPPSALFSALTCFLCAAIRERRLSSPESQNAPRRFTNSRSEIYDVFRKASRPRAPNNCPPPARLCVSFVVNSHFPAWSSSKLSAQLRLVSCLCSHDGHCIIIAVVHPPERMITVGAASVVTSFQAV